MHVIGIPSLVAVLVFGVSDLLMLNIIAYSVGTVYMLALLGKFLRRDFDVLCDHPVKFIVEIGVSYGIYYLSNFVIALILTAADSLSNPEQRRGYRHGAGERAADGHYDGRNGADRGGTDVPGRRFRPVCGNITASRRMRRA